jgi:diguanylate cyclase (GGDEF)-like protein
MSEYKVLVVDDDDAIANVVGDFLEEQGYTVIKASDGAQGIKAAETEKPHLILLDVGLGDMSGYDVCKKLKENPELNHTPIIMLTARDLIKDELKGLKAGADDYVTKPFKPVLLLARVQKAIERNVRDLDANSLTHLPGNRRILEAIKERIVKSKPYSVLYMDLNAFKEFNDHYGFVRGDEAIRLTSKILQKNFNQLKDPDAFLGHVGGDDFVGIVDSHDVKKLCTRIISDFDKEIPSLYDEEDRKKKSITAIDRKGHEVQVPLMGLAIAVVTNRSRMFQHPGEISFVAGDLKQWAKQKAVSTYVVDRRS